MPGSWGEQLRAAREEKGWDQAKLAKALGLRNYVTVSRWELGDMDPKPENLKALRKLDGKFRTLADMRIVSINGDRLDALERATRANQTRLDLILRALGVEIPQDA